MKAFFDTSFLVAVFWGDHSGHDQALGVFRDASPVSCFCASHSLAELYSVMTRLPVRPPIHPEQAILFLKSLKERISPISLTGQEYQSTIEQAAESGVTGGRIYDALILRCARKTGADRIYTLNAKDFARLAPDLADRLSGL